MTKPLIQVLQDRDDLSPEEANRVVSEMSVRVHNGENPEEVLHEHGLEPDYFLDLI